MEVRSVRYIVPYTRTQGSDNKYLLDSPGDCGLD